MDINVQYEKIGDRDYISREQFDQTVSHLSSTLPAQGSQMAISQMRNSPKTRGYAGIRG
jgi:hypothetical protein